MFVLSIDNNNCHNNYICKIVKCPSKQKAVLYFEAELCILKEHKVVHMWVRENTTVATFPHTEAIYTKLHFTIQKG